MDSHCDADRDCDRLVRGCLAGDEDCQRELIDRYAGLCCGVASRVLGRDGRSYVEDAVQETFYAVFAKLAQWRGGSLSAWIGTIAARRAIDMRRALQRRRVETTGLEPDRLAGTERQDGPAAPSELAQVIDAVRGELTARRQRLLDDLLAGRSRDQMAERLGVSVRTVQYELTEIRRCLKETLESVADWGRRGRL